MTGYIKDLWKSLPPFARHVASNMVVGLGIAILLIVFHSGQFLKGVEDMGMDWMMRMYRGVGHSGHSQLYAFIDIDEQSYQAWGEPWVTPRDKLARLVRYAAEGGAAVVLVDIDLSRPFDASADAVLRNYLHDYASGDGDSGKIPLVFMRSFRQSIDGDRQSVTLRPSFLDDVVEPGAGLHWASSLFDLEHDQVIRRWRLWEVLCGPASSDYVSSAQLLVRHLLTDKEARGVDLHEGLRRHAEAVCRAKDEGTAPEGKTLEIAGLNLHVSPNAIHKRIMYSMPWRLGPGETRPSVSREDTKVPLLAIRPAYLITDSSHEPDSNWLRGRVTVIGASYADSRDIHATPLGLMPGAMVLVNAIDSLIRYGEVNPPPEWVKLVVEAFLILVMSLAFARFHSFWGTLVSAIVVIGALLPISFMVFRSGVWLDFVIPLVAVLIHQLAAQYEEARAAATGAGHST